jgi:hypothetical protein
MSQGAMHACVRLTPSIQRGLLFYRPIHNWSYFAHTLVNMGIIFSTIIMSHIMWILESLHGCLRPLGHCCLSCPVRHPPVWSGHATLHTHSRAICQLEALTTHPLCTTLHPCPLRLLYWVRASNWPMVLLCVCNVTPDRMVESMVGAVQEGKNCCALNSTLPLRITSV